VRHHFRLGRRSKLSDDERFFYLGPPFLHPMLHASRITFPGLLGRPLQGPVHHPENLPYMSRVIVDTRQPLDNTRYAGKGPQIGGKTVSPGPLSQCRIDRSQLLSIQLRLAACPARASQCAVAASLPLPVPATYALPAYLQFSSNCRQDHPSSGEQTGRSLASLLHCSEISSRSNVCLHAYIIAEEEKYVTVLCEAQ
jgi:hypothetical protein